MFYLLIFAFEMVFFSGQSDGTCSNKGILQKLHLSSQILDCFIAPSTDQPFLHSHKSSSFLCQKKKPSKNKAIEKTPFTWSQTFKMNTAVYLLLTQQANDFQPIDFHGRSKKDFFVSLCLQRSFDMTSGYDDLIVSKFYLRKGDLIRSSQVLLLLFLMITFFI